MVSVNVEIKARDADPAATAGRCEALGAVDRGVLEQRDTYFAGRHGRLKLREEDGPAAELIAYRRPDAAEAEESASSGRRSQTPALLREALDAALGETVVVVKRRRLFVWENVRIHLDDVEGLGTFIELEALVGPGLNVRRGGGREGGAAALRAGHRRRRAGRGGLLRPAARRRPDAAARRRRRDARRPTRPTRSSRSAPPLRARDGAIYAGRQRRERRLPPGPVRRGLGDRRAGGRRASRRSPRWPSWPRRSRCARRAAAAASGWPSSGPPTRRCTWGGRGRRRRR